MSMYVNVDFVKREMFSFINKIMKSLKIARIPVDRQPKQHTIMLTNNSNEILSAKSLMMKIFGLVFGANEVLQILIGIVKSFENSGRFVIVAS
jgi:hypothetical protein